MYFFVPFFIENIIIEFWGVMVYKLKNKYYFKHTTGTNQGYLMYVLTDSVPVGLSSKFFSSLQNKTAGACVNFYYYTSGKQKNNNLWILFIDKLIF